MSKEIVKKKSERETQAEPKRIQLDILGFCWLIIYFFIMTESQVFPYFLYDS